MTKHWFTNVLLLAIGLSGIVLLAVGVAGTATAGEGDEGRDGGAVYTMTNDPAGNAVVVFERDADGKLEKSGTFPTGGTSIGVFATGNQDGLLLSDDGQCLWAVNSMSDSISAFQVKGTSLSGVNIVGSGGHRPISLTEHKGELETDDRGEDHDRKDKIRGLLYVLNAGGQVGSSDNITGFTVAKNCGLSSLAGSTQPLSAASTSPAEVGFDPSGRVLVVTEKTTNMITTFTVDDDGLPSAPISQASAGKEPFGFAFDKRGQLLVTEASCSVPKPPGNLPTCLVPPDKPALSSYKVASDGTLTLIDNSVDDQAAKCWVVITGNQRFAFTVNALADPQGGPGVPPAGSITSYRVDPSGTLTNLGFTKVPVSPAGVPIDMALSRNSRFLYVLQEPDGVISAYKVGSNGGLTLFGTFAVTAGPPLITGGAFPNGLAAR
jgi:6-phosphogluconolactonase